jgi:hypothetical protein
MSTAGCVDGDPVGDVVGVGSCSSERAVGDAEAASDGGAVCSDGDAHTPTDTDALGAAAGPGTVGRPVKTYAASAQQADASIKAQQPTRNTGNALQAPPRSFGFDVSTSSSTV